MIGSPSHSSSCLWSNRPIEPLVYADSHLFFDYFVANGWQNVSLSMLLWQILIFDSYSGRRLHNIHPHSSPPVDNETALSSKLYTHPPSTFMPVPPSLLMCIPPLCSCRTQRPFLRIVPLLSQYFLFIVVYRFLPICCTLICW